jgi:hypothetical protein
MVDHGYVSAMSLRSPLVLVLGLMLGLAACGNNDTKLKVTGLDPDKGDIEGGTYVRVHGNRFIADGARNAKVYFGSRQGTVNRFVNDNEMIVEAPGGKANETVDVLIIFEPGGEMKIPKGFTFVDKLEKPASVQDLDTGKPAK